MGIDETGTQEPVRRRRSAPTQLDAIPLPEPRAERIKTTIELDWSTHEKLQIHCLKLKVPMSRFLTDLINANCKRFVIQDRGGVRSEDAA